MKKTFIFSTIVLVMLVIFFIPLSVNAHPGRTDSQGGHTDHSTGEYHFHHGYPAHDHYDMDGDGDLDCPYDFDDKTNHGQGDRNEHTSDIGTTVKPDTKKEDSQSKQISLANIFSTIFEHLFQAIAIWLFSSYFLFYLFNFLFGAEQGCSLAMITGAFFVFMYIWFIFS